MKLGAQFYTIREFTKSPEDFEAALKKVADIGYKHVQISGTCDYTPEWLAEKLDKYGLKCVITHTPGNKMIENPELVADNHSVFSCKYIGLGSMPNIFSVETVPDSETVIDRFFEDYSSVMKAFKAKGKLLMYHNHHYEFARLPNGQNLIDYLASHTSQDELGFTLDTYWMQYGGVNPALFIKKLSGRVPCVHFKDYVIVRHKTDFVHMAPVGSGNLDWDSIIDACKKAGTEYVLVEQDNCYGEDPFECLKKSFNYLVSKGIEV